MALNLPNALDLLEEENNLRTFSTGSFWLDLAIGKIDPITGLPGIPEKAICEFFGPNQTFKTGTVEQLMKSVLFADSSNKVLLIGAEEPIFSRMERVLGKENLKRVSTWTFHGEDEDDEEAVRLAEEALGIAQDVVYKDKNYKLVIIDSIKALVSSKQMYDKKNFRDINDQVIAQRANLMNDFVPKFIACNKSKAILFMTNQISESIGPSFLTGENIKLKTSGGRGKEHFATLRVDCASVKIETEEHKLMNIKQSIGLKIFYTIIKNKYANISGYRRAISEFSFEENRFLREREVLSMAEYLGLVETARGGWYTIDGQKFHGQDVAERYLYEHEITRQNLEKEIIKQSDDFFVKTKANKTKAKDELSEIVL